MESLGDRLKAARESKGYNYDQISRDTMIASRYIQALEEEKFDVFPGEAYLLGFLRNYGEYLGLNPEELQNSYRALKIQEQPIPVEQLLYSPSPAPKIIRNAVIIVAVLAAGGFGFWFFKNRPLKNEVPNEVERREPQSYLIDGPFLERRFYLDDSALIPLQDNQYKIEVLSLGEAITLGTPTGQVILDLGHEVNLDLNLDSIGDVLITAVDFSKNDPASGVLLRLDVEYVPPPGGTAGSEPAASPAGQAEGAVNPATVATAPVVFTSPNAYPFTLQANFQGYCMFRWEILAERDRRDRNEQYFQRSDELNIQAQNGIRIWVSNAAAVKVQILGGGRTVPLEIGGAGEVVVADVRWIRDEDGRYRLALLRLE
ncbi:MAG: helix-turn-helix domain-containing protein [Treponema sp.]|nr:helix-turn-helix domain-containing protein [Treponema sp.]